MSSALASAPATTSSISPTGGITDFAKAIQSNESGGNYGTVGPTHPKYGRALGAYQVMESNIPSWTKEAIGRELSPDEFLKDKGAQDTVFSTKFGPSVAKYGNPQDAASVWFTGRPLAQGAERRDSLGTTGKSYVDKFTAALGGKGRKVASALADVPSEGARPTEFRIPEQGGGQAAVASAMSGQITPERLAASQRVLNNPYAPKSAQAIAQSIVTKALTPQEPKTTSVAPGSTLIDERTGKVIYEAPDRERNKPMSVAAGASVYDPRTNQFVGTAPDRDKSIENERKAREEAGGIRKEIHGLPSYKNYS